MAACYFLALVLFVGVCTGAPSRIVGGSPASIETYPSIVQMERFTPFINIWSQNCGGNILNQRNILSAAHCTHIAFDSFYSVSRRRIRAGSAVRNEGGVVINIAAILNYPNFNTLTIDGDICIIRLSSLLEYGSGIQNIPIIPQNFPVPDNVPVIHAGWGRDSFGGSQTPVLNDVSILSINREVCAERYLILNQTLQVTENMICAGLLDVGGQAACTGDSGGPLYWQNILIGVVSWSHRCAEPYYPTVSARVASYTNWIVANAS